MYFEQFYLGCLAHASYMLASEGEAVVIDPQRDIAGIILNRWGHAFVNPQPGFFFGKDGKPAPRAILRNAPFGRIALGNTDLAGSMDHRSAITETQRAVGQLMDRVLT